MRLVTFRADDGRIRAGVQRGQHVIGLEYPSLLELLRHPEGLLHARSALEQDPTEDQAYIYIPAEPVPHHSLLSALQPIYGEMAEEYSTRSVQLLPPILEPPTLRDFYAFEQHVKTVQQRRGLEMMSEWYEVPTFYFSNTSEIYGHEAQVPYSLGSMALDFELEIACVIGREGKNIPVEEAADYIAGYTIMNDWSARDFQLKDMAIGLGPGKGKDFATSLGPYLVTPDELSSYRSGEGSGERYNLKMTALVNGKEISHGNFKDIYYSFPQMITYASRNARLRIGDILGSGTVGTGCILELGTEIQPWLQRGDVLELAIDGLGILRNTIV